MQQKVYYRVEDLLTAATQLSAGAATHAVALGLVIATKPSIDAEMTALTDAIDALQAGRYDLRGKQTTLNTVVAQGTKTAAIIRDSLKRTFGQSYNPLWEGTPFNRTLIVPRAAGRLEQMLRSLKVFLVDNPTFELPGVATAAIAEAAADALGAARTAVQSQKSVVRALRTTRVKKEKAIRRRIRMVVEELRTAIGPIDARWEAFGLNQPGIKRVPTVPGKVTLVLASNNAVTVKWGPVPRAEYYRIWIKVKDRDEDFIPAGNSSEATFTIEDLPANAEVEITVSAANNGGESARSEVSKVKTV